MKRLLRRLDPRPALRGYLERKIWALLQARLSSHPDGFGHFYREYEYNHLPTILLAYMGQLHRDGVLTPENLHLCKSTGGQDLFVCSFFRNRKEGFFLELGALDGVFASNTYFLEYALGWRGLLIEADPCHMPALRANRPGAQVYQACILDRETELEFNANTFGGGGLIDYYEPSRRRNLDIVRLKTRRLQEVLDEAGVAHVDFLSLDVEGAELAVLRSIDFQRTSMTLLGIEVLDPGELRPLYDFMLAKGYRMVTRGRYNKVRGRDVFFADSGYLKQHGIPSYDLDALAPHEI